VLIALGAHRLVASIWVAEAAANLILSLTLVHSMGLGGVALGTLVPVVVGHLFVMLPAVCRKLRLSVAKCVRETTTPALVAGAVSSLVCVLLRTVRPPEATASIIAEGSLVAMAYIVALATIGFDGETRRLYASHGRRVAYSVVSAVRQASANARPRRAPARS